MQILYTLYELERVAKMKVKIRTACRDFGIRYRRLIRVQAEWKKTHASIFDEGEKNFLEKRYSRVKRAYNLLCIRRAR